MFRTLFLKKAHSYKILQENGETYLQFYDKKNKALEGRNCYWDGDLTVINKEITTLKGCPKVIIGTFDIAANPISSLEYGPKLITGSLGADYTHLKSFQHCPIVKENIHADDTFLEDISDLPNSFENFLYISGNQLENLYPLLKFNHKKNFRVKDHKRTFVLNSNDTKMISFYQRHSIKYELIEDSPLNHL